MLLDDQYQSLHHRLSSLAAITMAEVNAATDFAIDANAAGRADYSIAVLKPLADKMPHVAKIWQLLGLAWRDEQEMEKAAMAFDRAATLAPQDARIAMGKAQIGFETGRPAAELFQQIRTIAPQDGELALSTAAALVQEGNAEAGEALVQTLVSQNPGWLRGHDWLATTRWMMGDTDNFPRSYATAISAFPADKVIRMACYRAVAQPGRWDLAERVLADARAALGDQLEFTAAEAKIASETGEDDRAERLFAKLTGMNDPGITIAHIRHCLRTGHITRAEALATPLLDTPAASAVWPYMSAIWRLTGDDRAAWLDGDPAYVGQYDLPITQSALDALATQLRILHKTTQHPPEQSLRGGTQTQGHLLLRLEPEFQAIKAMILDAVCDFVFSLPPPVPNHPLLGKPRTALLFQGAWSVRLQGQGYHVVHTHPMGWISSAFYVALPDEMGEGQAGWLQLGAPPPDLRLDLAPYQMIEPKPGRLALFPSTMWHGTVPFDDGERLTIAFDMRVPLR